MKTSTASDWDLFEQTTCVASLGSLGHTCKWYFDPKRFDVDLWEPDLMRGLGLGTTVTFEDKFTAEHFEQLKQKVIEASSA